jgi:cytochrome P450
MKPKELAPAGMVRLVVDPMAYSDGVTANKALRWMRKHKPLSMAKAEGIHPFWIVTKHADILEISRQNDLFHNGDLSVTFNTIAGDARVRQITGGSPHILRTLVQMDAPDHTKHRLLTQSWFLPQSIRLLEDRIRQIAREHVNRMASLGGECDFATDIAITYPLRVIMEVLGVPPEDEPRMLRLTQELFGAADPDLNRSGAPVADNPAGFVQMRETIDDFFQYFKKLTDDRRAGPRNDLATVLANGEIDGAPISDFEAMSYYIIVATAGHETTSSCTAGAIWGLSQNPDQFAKVKADLSLIPGLVEESIRWTSPVKHFMRTAVADYQLRGQTIEKGDWIWLSYPSGNRDEEVFDDPEAFNIERSPNRQLSFGYGAHLCLGQHLARMEMRILWEELLPRLEWLELAGKPEQSLANFIVNLKRLPIRYRMS